MNLWGFHILSFPFSLPQIVFHPFFSLLPQELTNCVREQVMMDYLFGKGDWTHYMPTEEGSGFGGSGFEVDDFLLSFSSIQAGRDSPEFAKGLESLGGECRGAASLIDVLEIFETSSADGSLIQHKAWLIWWTSTCHRSNGIARCWHTFFSHQRAKPPTPPEWTREAPMAHRLGSVRS